MTTELFKDPFAKPDENEASDDTPEGSNCEVSFCDARCTATGDRTFLNSGVKRYFDAPRKSGRACAALAVTKFYDKKGNLEYIETSIRSPHIKAALKAVVKEEFPGLNLTSDTLTTRNFSECLFFHHKELREYGQSLEDEEAARHVNLVLEHLYRTLGRSMQTFRENVDENIEADGKEPVLDFRNLWMAFRPGDLVAIKVRDEYDVYQVKQTMNIMDAMLGLYLLSLRCDGEYIGHSTTHHYISESECVGFTRLRDLSIIPLKYLQESGRDRILSAARSRGDKFIRLSTGIHHCDYHGLVELTREMEDEDGYHYESTQTVNGRVIIDSQKFSEMRPEHVTHPSADHPRYNISKGEQNNIPETARILASREILGFCLTSKKWGMFNIEFCSDVCYNEQAFGKLILPSLQKDLIRSLVTAHERGKLGFDDIIEGKGKGMTILLHGTPGVGKTLTAESVAEHAKKPLYAVTAANFTKKVSTTESKLNEVFELAAHWNAVLLIDEADVILTQRTFADVDRNAVVAVFLRALEYYSGVLILTTNRVTSLDTAFRSRIHLGIKYQPLSTTARREIWQTFIGKSTSANKSDFLDGSLVDEISSHQFDGRMIKNAVRMAHAMAVDEDVPMGASHVRKAVEALRMFGHDMDEAEKEEGQQYIAPAAIAEGSRKRKRTT